MQHRKRHKSDSKTINEETWKERAGTINATILNLERAIKVHIKRAPGENRKTPRSFEQNALDN